MRKDDVKMLALFALGALVLTRRRVVWGDGWVWPVAPIEVAGRVYRPFISDGFTSMRGDELHAGVDIVYPRRGAADLVREYPPGTPGGGRSWFAPPNSPVVAARAGKIWHVRKTGRGWSVLLDHGKSLFSTWYQHLDAVAFPTHTSGKNDLNGTETFVSAGQFLGPMGFSPLDAERVRHLHFAVGYDGALPDAAVDPAEAMRSWAFAQTYKV